MPLNDFIQDFGLRNSEGAVIFNAIIEFLAGQQKEREQSEVHIVKILDKETIYLLGPGINSRELPDFFDDKACTFSYIPDFCLRIDGKREGMEYIVLIFPVK